MVTLATVYHTTMRWLGRQSASTRLLAIQIAQCPEVIDALFASWRDMCVSTSPVWHWCRQAASAEIAAGGDLGDGDSDPDSDTSSVSFNWIN